jgi:hypothetical protein
MSWSSFGQKFARYSMKVSKTAKHKSSSKVMIRAGSHQKIMQWLGLYISFTCASIHLCLYIHTDIYFKDNLECSEDAIKQLWSYIISVE